MQSIWDIPIIVVDVETTGNDPIKNRVMEVACVVVRSGQIESEYSTLINPRQAIPPFISKMTGIATHMVVNAPNETEIMPELAKMFGMPDAVFSAHHAAFDWGFVQGSMSRSGLAPLKNHVLCTYKLAKRLMPKSVKKNVGAVAKYFGIDIRDRHRALDDARATAMFLLEFLEIAENDYDVETIDELLQFQNRQLRKFAPTPSFLKKLDPYLDSLPGEPGVYRMFDKKDNLLYVGKAKSLRKRVRSYFQAGAQHTPKIAKMVRFVTKIEWTETGTEIRALLQESREIKAKRPPYNSAGVRLRRMPFIRLSVDEDFPRITWARAIDSDGAEYFGPFRSRSITRSITETIQKDFNLRHCIDTLVPNPQAEPCFYYHIKRCGAPCAGLQSKEEYRLEVERVRTFLGGSQDGIVASLEREMMLASDQLRFEEAAAIRNRLAGIRRIFDVGHDREASVQKSNLVVILPNSGKDKTIELYAVKEGRLSWDIVVGRKAPLGPVVSRLLATFYGIESELDFSSSEHPSLFDNQGQLHFDLEYQDEVNIISSWLHKQRRRARVLSLNLVEAVNVERELAKMVADIDFDQVTEEMSYDDLPA